MDDQVVYAAVSCVARARDSLGLRAYGLHESVCVGAGGMETAVPPVIPGFTPLPLPGAVLLRSRTRCFLAAAPAATPEQTTLGALQEAQATREAVRKLAR